MPASPRRYARSATKAPLDSRPGLLLTASSRWNASGPRSRWHVNRTKMANECHRRPKGLASHLEMTPSPVDRQFGADRSHRTGCYSADAVAARGRTVTGSRAPRISREESTEKHPPDLAVASGAADEHVDASGPNAANGSTIPPSRRTVRGSSSGGGR